MPPNTPEAFLRPQQGYSHPADRTKSVKCQSNKKRNSLARPIRAPTLHPTLNLGLGKKLFIRKRTAMKEFLAELLGELRSRQMNFSAISRSRLSAEHSSFDFVQAVCGFAGLVGVRYRSLCVQHFSFQHFSFTPNPPFPRPPISAAYFAEATKAKKASFFAISFAKASSYAKASADKTAVKKATADKTTGRQVWPPALSTAFTTKANS